MFSRNIIDDSRSVTYTSRAIRMTVVSDTTTWSITYNRHSDNARGVIYKRNIFIILVTLNRQP
jgi:hypothetical protein